MSCHDCGRPKDIVGAVDSSDNHWYCNACWHRFHEFWTLEQNPLKVKQRPSVVGDTPGVYCVDKPGGWFCPGAGCKEANGRTVDAMCKSGSMESIVSFLIAEDIPILAGAAQYGVLHRLDPNLSGLLLVAKDPNTMDMMEKQIRQRCVKVYFLAMVAGQVSDGHGFITAPVVTLIRGSTARLATLPGENAHALSEYWRLAACETHSGAIGSKLPYTLLLVRCEWMNTVELRAHLALGLGHPVLADEKYGAPPAEKQISRLFVNFILHGVSSAREPGTVVRHSSVSGRFAQSVDALPFGPRPGRGHPGASLPTWDGADPNDL